VLQQLEHGLLSVVGGYESLGRLYRGIIEPTQRQYAFMGDGALMTDNVVFDAAKTPEATAPRVGMPGSPDDRWVFTEANARHELLTAAALAAAARSMRGYNEDLAARALKIAIELYEHAKPESRFDRVGAAAELLLTTKEPKYRLFLIEQRDAIVANIDKVGWVIGRTLPLVKNADYSKAIRAAVAAYRLKVEALAAQTPYGVPYKPDIVGTGWLIQRFGWDQWMLHLSFPDLFPRTYALQALSFILGVHPGSNNASFVSGVGANSPSAASYIPGGSASGTALIRPDFPELKHWPFSWQQTEYLPGHGTMDYLLLVVAADHELNQQ
jgi:endoglucanase